MNPDEWELVYSPPVQADLARLVHILGPVMSPKTALSRPDLLKQTDIILSGWGGPKMDRAFLDLVPGLQGVFYGAGAVGHLLSEEFWQREIVVTTANEINAIPVAEFTLAHILLAMKRTWLQAVETKRRRAFLKPPLPVPGGFGSTVGLISLGTIGRQVRQRLEPFDFKVIAYDPTLDDQDAAAMNVERVSLDEIFARADVVSLHTPLKPETEGMITGSHLASMRHGATFINTARGSIVREDEMITVLEQRPDLTAILDVTDPEPPRPDCALFDLPNVVLTPHIAGSLEGECARMGHMMASEVRRFLADQPLRGLVSPGQYANGSETSNLPVLPARAS